MRRCQTGRSLAGDSNRSRRPAAGATRARFCRKAERAARLVALGLGVSITSFLLAGCNRAESTLAGGAPSQPVQFNHSLHVAELELECTNCHLYAVKSRKASLPTVAVCAECHSELQGDSPEEKKLVGLIEAGQKLQWQRVYVLPKHVYFSHFRHVTLGQLACPECHGAMRELKSPPTRPATDIINMAHCIDCHRQREVNIDCLTCHI